MRLVFLVSLILSPPSNGFMEGKIRPETSEQRTSEMEM